MVNWGEIREKGKQRFVLQYSAVVSIPFLIDYFLVKFLLNSFTLKLAWMEVIIVWVTCFLLANMLAIYGWNRLEKDWHKIT